MFSNSLHKISSGVVHFNINEHDFIGNKIATLTTMSIVYPELSYKIVGILYRVYNKLGAEFQEKHYQKAVKQELTEARIPFLEQVRTEMYYKNISIGRYFLDFIIDHKIVLELKTNPYISKKYIIQVLSYLKTADLKLGIIASFSKKGLILKRILKGHK